MMLSDAFKELLSLQERRLEDIQADCLPFANRGEGESATVHQRIVDEVNEILRLTRIFKDTDLEEPEEQHNALKAYGIVSYASMNLAHFLFNNSNCSGPFRNKALQGHGAVMQIIAREQILICVNAGWAIIGKINERSRLLDKELSLGDQSAEGLLSACQATLHALSEREE